MIKALKFLLLVGVLMAVFHPASAFAADRYWVGGSGTWDGSDTTHWSATSGGAGGASRPSTNDNVIFDSASNATAYTVTIAGTSCEDLTVGNPASGVVTLVGTFSMHIYGSLFVASGVIWTQNNSISFNSTSAETITTNGTIFPGLVVFSGTGGSWTLQDNFRTNSLFRIGNGTFDANNFNVTAARLDYNFDGPKALIMGSGTWTMTSGSTPSWDTTGVTVTPNTSTIKFTDTTAGDVGFTGGGATFNNVWFARGSSTGRNIILDSSTFNDFKDTGTGTHSLIFTAGTTQTVSSFTVSGTVGHVITINSDTTGTHSLVKAGGGTVSSDYLNIQHSVATPGSTWYVGTHSISHQGTATAGSGWIFAAVGPAHMTSWRGIVRANIRSFGSVLIGSIAKWVGVN